MSKETMFFEIARLVLSFLTLSAVVIAYMTYRVNLGKQREDRVRDSRFPTYTTSVSSARQARADRITTFTTFTAFVYRQSAEMSLPREGVVTRNRLR